MPDIQMESTLDDGRLRCQGVAVNGQCKNEAGWKTAHPGSGNCTYHDRVSKVELLDLGMQPVQPLKKAQARAPKPIYDKGLVSGDPKRLYRELSGHTSAESLQLKSELDLARSTLLRLQKDQQAGRFTELKDFYQESSRLLDTISKLVERSQPKSTLTINTVQAVLMKVVEVVHSEINDPVILERIIQKLASVPLNTRS